jgi:hypothetical protein
MTLRIGTISWLLALAAASGCGGRTLKVSSRPDAGRRPPDDAARVDVEPIWQAPIDGLCPAGYAPCGAGEGLRCYDLGQAQEHCGACGNACAAGIACQAGACQQHVCKGALSFKTVVFASTGTISALADFDGDGILDVVGGEGGGTMSLLYGAGDGTFPTQTAIATSDDLAPPDGGLPLAYLTLGSQAVAADLDGDGHPDLASVRDGEAAVTVRRGTGDRDVPFAEPTRYPTGDYPLGVVLADFEADGRLDMVAGRAQAFDYWRGLANGAFASPVALESPDLQYGPGMATAVDWNGDGALDLVYGDGGFAGIWRGAELGAGGRLHYRLGHGDGTFEPEVACALAMGLTGDLDKDHRPDLISASGTRGASLLLGIDGCSASQTVSISDWTKQGGIAYADLNGDGNLDVVVDDNLAIMVHVGDGKGGFPHDLTMPAPTPNGQWPLGVFLVGDLNLDGKLDVIFARDGGWGVLLNTCP